MSTHYTAGGMPLAFTQEDFLVIIIFTCRKRRISSYKENLWLSDINPEQYFKTLRLGMKSNGRGLNKLTKIMFKSTQDNQEKAASRQVGVSNNLFNAD